jgi:hypothetical protein
MTTTEAFYDMPLAEQLEFTLSDLEEAEKFLRALEDRLRPQMTSADARVLRRVVLSVMRTSVKLRSVLWGQMLTSYPDILVADLTLQEREHCFGMECRAFDEMYPDHATGHP